MIDGVRIKALKRVLDDRGYLLEVLRDDDAIFQRFGQAYVSACFAGIIKAWHMHRIQTDHFCVVSGNMKVGLFDDRKGSPTCGQAEAIVIGELNPVLVAIPPLVWHGMMPVGGETALLLNIPTEHYNPDDPDEVRRDPLDPEIPFEWVTRGG
jgi:dTDP-4-dehydrorhamnose 3,5-epimerase